MSTLLLFGQVIGVSIGPADLFVCSGLSVFTYTALMSFAFGTVHVGLMVIAFKAHRRGDAMGRLEVYLMHGILLYSTLLGELRYGCYMVVSVQMLLASAVLYRMVLLVPTVSTWKKLR